MFQLLLLFERHLLQHIFNSSHKIKLMSFSYMNPSCKSIIIDHTLTLTLIHFHIIAGKAMVFNALKGGQFRTSFAENGTNVAHAYV